MFDQSKQYSCVTSRTRATSNGASLDRDSSTPHAQAVAACWPQYQASPSTQVPSVCLSHSTKKGHVASPPDNDLALSDDIAPLLEFNEQFLRLLNTACTGVWISLSI